MSRIRGRSEDKTFVYMWSGARHMLGLARQSEEGQVYTLISAQVFSAFMVEAYLNHLGCLKHEDWLQTERRRSKYAKLRSLAEEAGLQIDMNVRPYSSITELFERRDSMAHGMTEVREVDEEVQAHLSIAQSLIRVGWQAGITVEQTESLLGDAVTAIRTMHEAAGYQGDPFATSGSELYALPNRGA